VVSVIETLFPYDMSFARLENHRSAKAAAGEFVSIKGQIGIVICYVAAGDWYVVLWSK
jgi:hypothetical protein